MRFFFRKMGRYCKRRYYCWLLGLHDVHPTFYIGGKCSIASDFKAGAYSYVGLGCAIYPRVEIGAYTMLANNVSVIGGDHNYKKAGVPMIFSGRPEMKKTVIGRDCWIGAHSIIMAGISIGDGAIVAAGSVVTKDVEPYSIYGGVPAHKIKPRFETEEEKEKHIQFLSRNPENLRKYELSFAPKIKCNELTKVKNGGGNLGILLVALDERRAA